MDDEAAPPPQLRREPAERLARSALPASAAVWTAAEILHAAHAPWTDIGIATALAAALAYGTTGHHAKDRKAARRHARHAATATLTAGTWLAIAAEAGPLAGPWCAVSLAWAGLSLAGWLWLRRHELVIAARDWRTARTDWLSQCRRWGLGGSHLLHHEQTRLGERMIADVTGTGRRASQLARGDIAERIAEDRDLPSVSRVQVRPYRPGQLEISIRTEDPWANPVTHPVLADAPEIDLSGSYSIRKPAVVGQDPETGRALRLPLYDERGGKNISVVSIKGGGKALALDTPLPTPSGWTTMGEVQPGDWLLDADGKPTRVMFATDVMHGRPCYEVEFSDGTVIVADEEHLWLTEDRRAWTSAKRARQGIGVQRSFPQVRTTAEIAATLKVPAGAHGPTSNHGVANCKPLSLPAANLPVPPYTLGAWLGDGTERRAEISTADPEILACIEADGIQVSKVESGTYEYRLRLARSPAGQRVYGDSRRKRACARCGFPCTGSGSGMCRPCWVLTSTLQGRLRALGVLGDKHIPASYLRASEDQRRALLAGLLDTDGHCQADGGIEFAVTSRRLAQDTRELISSLGYSSRLRTKRVAGHTEESSTCYIVSFTPPDKVFALPRKAARQHATKGEIARRRLITDVRPVPAVPVKCIQVDNADKLYLAGPTCIPTHNTVLLNCASERVTAARDALLVRVNLSIKGLAEAQRWGPACHLTAFGRQQRSRAVRVLRVLNKIIEYRSQQVYDTDVFIPSPGDPQIVLIMDEYDSAVQVPAIRHEVEEIARRGREYGVSLLRANQRGTADSAGGANIRAQDDVFCLGMVNRRGEMMHAAGDLGLTLPDMASYGEGHAGVWVIAELGAGHDVGRTFSLKEPADIQQIVAERAYRQPDLKPELKAFLGESYEDLLSTDIFAQWAAEQEDRPVTAHPRPDATPEAPSVTPAAQPAPVTVINDDDTLKALDFDAEATLDDDLAAKLRRLDQRNADTARILAENAQRPIPQIDPDKLAAHTAARWDQEAEHTVIPDDMREKLLALVAGEGISARQAVNALGIPEAKRTKVTWWLNRLRWEGLVKLEGKGRAARWKLVTPPD